MDREASPDEIERRLVAYPTSSAKGTSAYIELRCIIPCFLPELEVVPTLRMEALR